MMYAVVEAGGKQFLAQEGKTIEVDRMVVEVGQQIDLADVLLVVDGLQIKVGAPMVEGALVRATEDPGLQVHSEGALPADKGPPPALHPVGRR